MRVFSIFGDIVEDGFKQNESDICLQDFKNFLDTVEDNENVMIDICSCGGSVFQGLAISNLIGQFRKQHNCYFTAHVVSVAASIASVIASACDEIQMDENSVFMIHLPYSYNVTGNAIELQKEIDQLNQCKKALIAFYKTKFDKTEEEIEKLLEEETWIAAEEAKNYGLRCEVIKTTQPMRIAASIKDKMKTFNKLPTNIREKINMENEEETKEIETSQELSAVSDEVKEEVINEQTQSTEEVVEVKAEEIQPNYEELQKKVEELTSELDACKKNLDECQKKIAAYEDEEEDKDIEARISKCQSVFQNKINNFKNELMAKDKELQNCKDSVSRLNTELEKTTKELHDMSAAFEEKKNALDKLNSSVLSPAKSNSTDWRTLKGEQFIKWAEAHKDEIKNNKIR